MTTEPPFYILYSSSPINTNAAGAPSTSLGHPTIQYYFADDPPISLLPQSPDEHVLVLDFDPTSGAAPTVRSISKNIAVTTVKVAEAPGAAAEDELKRNDRMYILETTTTTDDKCVESYVSSYIRSTPYLRRSTTDVNLLSRQTPQAILAQFKQRWVMLHAPWLSRSSEVVQEMPSYAVHLSIRTQCKETHHQ
jgi:hypothetical protein